MPAICAEPHSHREVATALCKGIIVKILGIYANTDMIGDVFELAGPRLVIALAFSQVVHWFALGDNLAGFTPTCAILSI